jgi:hypothetical protein
MTEATAAGGLEQLLERYEETLLAGDFRERIRAREQAGHFPFSVQNIYRVLLALARPFHAAFATLAETVDLTGAAAQERLGRPARAFRSFHVVAVGAFEAGPLDMCDRALLERIASGFALRAAGSVAIPAERMHTIEDGLSAAGIEPVTAARASVYLREYVDYLFLGQHDHGYATYPPRIGAEGDLVVREFSRLPVAVVGSDSLCVCTRYRAGACRSSSYDPMRGDVERLPGPADLIGAAVLTGSGSSVVGQAQLEAMDPAIAEDLSRLRAEYEELSPVRAEQRVAEWFFEPALALLEDAGIASEPWRWEVAEAVAAAHKPKAGQPPSWTDLYLDRLAAAVVELRGTG